MSHPTYPDGHPDDGLDGPVAQQRTGRAGRSQVPHQQGQGSDGHQGEGVVAADEQLGDPQPSPVPTSRCAPHQLGEQVPRREGYDGCRDHRHPAALLQGADGDPEPDDTGQHAAEHVSSA